MSLAHRAVTTFSEFAVFSEFSGAQQPLGSIHPGLQRLNRRPVSGWKETRSLRVLLFGAV